MYKGTAGIDQGVKHDVITCMTLHNSNENYEMKNLKLRSKFTLNNALLQNSLGLSTWNNFFTISDNKYSTNPHGLLKTNPMAICTVHICHTTIVMSCPTLPGYRQPISCFTTVYLVSLLFWHLKTKFYINLFTYCTAPDITLKLG